MSGTQNSLSVPGTEPVSMTGCQDWTGTHTSLTQQVVPFSLGLSFPPTGLLLSQTPSEYSIDLLLLTALKM